MALTLEERVDMLEKKDADLISEISRIKEDTELLVDLLKNSQSAFTVIRWIVRIVNYLGGIALAVMALWGLWIAFKTGQYPGGTKSP